MIVVKPIDKRIDEVTKIKFMNLWDRFVYPEKKQQQDEGCPLAKNEPVGAKLLGDISNVMLYIRWQNKMDWFVS